MKKLLSLALVIVVLTLSITGAASAQDGGPDKRKPGDLLGRGIIGKVAEAVGIEPLEVLQQMRENEQTLGEFAEASGLDVAALSAEIIAEATETVNQAVEDGKITQERADAAIERLPEAVANAFDRQAPSPMPGRAGVLMRGAKEIINAAADALGMEPQEVLKGVHEGEMTPAAFIEANGGDVAAVQAAAVEAITARINEALDAGNITQEQADKMLEEVETFVEKALTSQPRSPRPEVAPIMREALQEISDATGLSVQEILAELQTGKTPREVIEENGGDVDAIIGVLVGQFSDQLRERFDQPMRPVAPPEGE
jgi:polyhydroxyalkanoate synthesis regulator phasin